MKTETSAGGIVLRKTAKGWDVLVVRDMNNKLTFPKGNVEKGENEIEAAKREIFEEVGIADVTPVTKLPTIHYWYRRGGLIRKTVHYFVFTSEGKEKLMNQVSEGVHDATWMPMKKATGIIGYPKTNEQLLLWTLKALRTSKK